MMKENLEREVTLIYDATKEIFKGHMEALEEYVRQRLDIGELQDIEDEEMKELLPDASEEVEKLRKANEMLSDDSVREKWVALVTENLNSEVSEEDFATLEAAALIEERIEQVFQSGSQILVAWVAKESDDTVVVQ